MKRTIKLNESDLHRIIRESIKRLINEEIDTGQVPSASERRYSKSPDSPKIKDIKKKIRQLRHMISEYDDEGKDISGLQKQIQQLKKEAGFTTESRIHSIVKESVNKILKESFLYTGDIDTSDLRINAHWTEDGYAEWEAWVDNGWYTFRGTYDGHDCELEEIIEGHSGYGKQHDIDEDAIEWFDENLRDKIAAWVDKYADSFEDWHNETYGDEY